MPRDDVLLGYKELNAALKELTFRKQLNAIRNAARAALKPTADKVKAIAPIGTESHRTFKGRLVAPGFASRNININSYIFKDKTGAGATVGTKAEAFYLRMFQEIGTRFQPAQPTLRPAYEITRRVMEQRFRIELRKKIIQQAKKVRKPRSRR